jgi:hypothetical protein
MYNIQFNGYLECSDLKTFQIAFGEFLKKIESNFHGQIVPHELPDYVDYQIIDASN